MAKRRKRTESKEQKMLEIGYLRNLAKEDPTAPNRSMIIKQAMSDKGYTVSDILKRANISFQLFSMFMAGRVNIEEDDLNKIAEMLELEPDTIMQKIPHSTAGYIISRISDDFSNNQEKFLSGAKNLTENEQAEDEEETSKKISDEDVKEMEQDLKQVASDDFVSEFASENVSANPTDNETDTKAENAKTAAAYVPKTEELLAAYTLFNNEGKAKFFEMAWDILKNPKYRVGGVS